MPPPVQGNKYVYDPPGGKGYGEHAKGNPLTAEMTELDLKAGMIVTCFGFDADNVQWVIISWVDGTGIDRMTTIDPGLWNSGFRPAT